MNYRYRLGNFTHIPGVSIEGFDIYVSSEIDVHEFINKLISYFHANSFKIHNLDWSIPVDDFYAVFIVFSRADEYDISKLIEDIKSRLPGIVKISKSPKPRNDIVYSESLYPIYVEAERVAFVNIDTLKLFVKHITEYFGRDISASFLYHAGNIFGKSLYNVIKNMVSIEDINEFLEYLKGIFLSHGWCLITEYKSNNKYIELEIKDLIECEIISGNLDKPWFFKGVLHGIFSSLYEADVDIVEEKYAKEGDIYCLFKVIKSDMKK